MQWNKRQCRLAAALLALLTAAAYHNSFGGPFIFDDVDAVAKNANLHRLWPVWEAARAPDGTTLTRRPVTTLTFALNYAISGPNVASYHVVNLLIHVAAGLVLFGVMRRTLAGLALSPSGLRSISPRAAEGLALVVAAFWMLHPLQTDTVTYLVQRTEALMGLFYLLTLYCAIRGFSAEKPAAGRWWHAAAVAFCALGMGSKEVMISAPLFVLLYDRTLVSGGFGAALRRRPGLYAGLAATWVLLAAFVLASPHAHNTNFSMPDLTPWDYLKTQAGVLIHYLRLSLWPSPLALDYHDWPIAQSLRDVPVMALLLIPAMLATSVWLVVRRSPAALPAALFFMVLAPTSSILPMRGEVAAERRMYLPLAGILSLSVVGGYVLLRRAAKRRIGARNPRWHGQERLPVSSSEVHGQEYLPMPPNKHPWAVPILASAVCLACLVGTVRRNTTYRTELSAWTDAVTKRPGNSRAWNNLGKAYADLGKFDEAIECFACAVEIGTNPDAPGNLGLMLCRQGRHAEAVPHLLESLRVRSPNPWGVYYNLGGALVRLGRVTEALPHLAEAARLAPDEPATRAGYGFALLQAGRTGPALAELREAHRLNPAGAMEMRHLAWALATHNDPQHRNPAEAVRLAEAARDLTGGTNPVVLDTLAAAYADAGRTDDAVRTGLRAEELAKQAGIAPLARDARRRVDDFYRAGRPFREDGPAVARPAARPQVEASINGP